MSKPLRERERHAAAARRQMQEATEAFAERLGEIADDTRLTGAGKLDAARRLVEERRAELGRLGQAEAEALAEYADQMEVAAMARPWADRSPMASRPNRSAFVGRDGRVVETRYREALRDWRESLTEASYAEISARTAMEAFRDMPPEVLGVQFERALAEGDVGTARAVQALSLQRIAGSPVPEGMESDVEITPDDWAGHALVERELGPSVNAVPIADPASWALIQRIAKAEEATMSDGQRAAREEVSTGSHRVPATSVDQALAGAGIAGEVLLATQEGLEGQAEGSA